MDIIPFDYNGKTITTLTKEDGSIWFIANEVCRIAGFSNPRDAIRNHIRDHQKDVVNGDTLGGRQKQTIINEGGLYRLLLRTKLKKATKFQDWVTDKVLPEIRKTGSYSVQPKLPQNYKEALRHLIVQVEANEKLEAENTKLKPKAKVYDQVSSSTGLVCISDAAKILQIPVNTFFGYLARDGYIFERRGKWTPYAPYADREWFEVKLVPARDRSGHTYRQTFVTPKGVQKFREIYNPNQQQQRLFA